MLIPNTNSSCFITTEIIITAIQWWMVERVSPFRGTISSTATEDERL